MTRWKKSRVFDAPDGVRGDAASRTRELSAGTAANPDSTHHLKYTHLRGTVSRRVLMETFEPRLLLSADLFPIAGTISAPGEEDNYQITFAEPTRVSFDTLTQSELSWRLRGPGDIDIGTTLDRADGSSRGVPAVLDVARGTYTLTVFGSESQTGDYEFQLNDLSDDPVLPMGTPVAVSLPRGTDSLAWTFDGQAGQFFNLELSGVTESLDATISIVSPSGSTIRYSNLASTNVTLTETGQYVLLIDGNITRSAPVAFSMAATLGSDEPREYAFGNTANDTLDTPGERHVHHFTLASHTRVALSGSTTFGAPAWTLRGKAGEIASNLRLPSVGAPLILDLEAGEYWLVTTGYQGRTGAYDFQIVSDGAYAGTPVAATEFASTLGAPITGTFAGAAGEEHRYAFTVGADTDLILEMLDRNSNIELVLEGVGGQVFAFNSNSYWSGLRDFGRVTPGTYWLTVRSQTEAAGAYAMRLQDIAADSIPITLGTSFAVALDADRSVEVRTVDLQAGDRVFFDVTDFQATAGNNFNFRADLFAPDGRMLESFTQSVNSGEAATVPVDGTYRIEFRRDDTARIERIEATLYRTSHVTLPLALGTPTTVTLDTPGKIVDYVVDIDAATNVVFDRRRSVDNSGAMNVQLLDPDGNSVFSRSVNSTSNLVRAQVYPGRYILRMSMGDDETGSTEIALLDDRTAPLIPRGIEQTGSIDPGESVRRWAVDAVAGQRTVFEFTEFAGKTTSGNPHFRVFSPEGDQIEDINFNGGAVSFDPPRDGRYLVLIEPQTGQSAPITYAFTMRTAPFVEVPMTVGTRVDGSIPVPFGRTDHAFSLGAETLLYFDALTNTGARVTILDSEGNSVPGLSTDFNVYNGSGRSFRLVQGDYLLRIEPDGAEPVDYSFVLRDLSVGTAVPLGDEITQSMDENAVVRYFDISTPGPVYVDSTDNSGNAYWQVLDPFGNVISGPSGAASDMAFYAVDSGRYTLIIDERPDRPSGSEVTFRVTQSTVSTRAITPGTVVTGTIDAPGDTVRHTFTLNGAKKLAFKGEISTDNLTFRLERNGVPQTDAASFRRYTFDQAQMDLIPGDYTLVVESIGDFTGEYRFELLDFADAVVLADNVSPGLITVAPPTGGHVYRWDGTAGQVVEFERLSSSNNFSFAMYDPDGGRLFEFNSFRDVPNIQLRKTGAYYILIYGYATNTGDDGSFAFAMRETGTIAADPPSGTPLALGEVAVGTLGDASTPDSYLITLTEPTRLIMDGQTNSSRITLTLRDALGEIMAPRTINKSSYDVYSRSDRQNATSTLDLAAGTYQVDVVSNTASDAYAFSFLNVDSGVPLPLDETQTVLTDPANSTILFHFDATEGEYVKLDMVNNGADKRWHIIAPDGTEVSDGNFLLNTGFRAKMAGRYVLVIDGHGDETVPSTVDITRRDGTPRPITFGAEMTANLTGNGSVERYSFTLAEKKSLYFDSRFVNSNRVNWRVYDAEGREVAGVRIDNADGRDFRLEPGDYQLVLSTTWPYDPFTFRLLDMGDAQAITLGQEVTVNEPVATDRRVFSFEGTAGQNIIFDLLSFSGNSYSGEFRLIKPNGHELARQSMTDLSQIRLGQTGTWTLVMLPPTTREGSLDYSFRIIPQQEVVQALEFGERRRDTPPDTRARMIYTFTKATAGEVYFDSQLNHSNALWEIRDAKGMVVASNIFSRDIGDNSRVWLGAGDHTLTVQRTDDQVTELPFRLLDLATVPEITPGAPITPVLNPGNVTQAFRFDGQAGQRFKLALAQGTTYSAGYRLLGPDGQEVFAEVNAISDRDPFTLHQTGTYVLLIEGRVQLTEPFTLGLNLLEVPYRAAVPASSAARVAPDLVPSSVSVSAAGPVQAGMDLTVSWTETNAGAVGVVPGRDRVILRRVDTGEIVGVRVIAAGTEVLGAGASVTRQATLNLPSGALGAGDLIAEVEVDIANDIDETDGGIAPERNNIATVAFTALNDQLADLVVENIRAEPASGYKPGDTVTVRWTLRNTGGSDVTQPFIDQLRLRNLTPHNDPTLDVQSLAYDPATSGVIAAGATVERSTTITWPDGVDGTGTMGFEITTDLDNAVPEDNDAGTGETNNTTVFEVINAPDLVIEGLKIVEADPQAGDTVTFTWTIRNAGTADLPVPFRSLVQLTNLDARDTPVNQRIDFEADAGVLLPVGATRTRSFTTQLPDGASGTGNLRFRVYVDNGSSPAVIEVNADGDAENNNFAELSFTSREQTYPDLSVTAPTVTGAAVAGRMVQLDWRVTNGGDAGAGERVDRVILSSDETLGNGDDIVLDNVTRPALAVGASDDVSVNVMLPGDQVGDFHLFVVTDAEGAIVEGDDEDNNSGGPTALTIAPGAAPDLVVEAVAGPNAASWGESVPVSWRVGNAGTTASDSNWLDRVYLSEDGVFDEGDILLAEVAAPAAPLVPGGSYTASANVSIPPNLTGAYRLIVVTDAANTQAEGLGEGNNQGLALEPVAISAVPAADLVVRNVEGPADGSPGDVVRVTWRTENVGEATARAPFTDRVYLSPTGTLSGARSLGNFTHSAGLDPGQGVDVSLDVTLPSLAEGTWRFLVVTDINGQVFEAGREDNAALDDDPFGLATPDFQVTNVSAPDAATSDSVITVNWTVQNAGFGNAVGGRVDRILLSRDGIADGNDIVLHTTAARDALAAGGSDMQSVDVRVPIDVSGDWQLIVVADATDRNEEQALENNNHLARALAVQLADHADLAVTEVTA
ncbi:MAG: CARDB domain-containing protein, partial [Roseovarius sp.]|nr:CARDB domain-containing protein [Roseovarius sp.]